MGATSTTTAVVHRLARYGGSQADTTTTCNRILTLVPSNAAGSATTAGDVRLAGVAVTIAAIKALPGRSSATSVVAGAGTTTTSGDGSTSRPRRLPGLGP